MILRLCDRIGQWCVRYPWAVLTCYGLLALALLPFLLRLSLESDVRDSLPGDMARAMERHNALFGSADRAFIIVQAPTSARETLLTFASTLQEQLAPSPLIRRVEFGYPAALLATLGELSLEYAPLFVPPEHLDDFLALFQPEGIQAQLQKTLLQLSLPGVGAQDALLLDDPLQLRRFVLARLAALRGTFRFDATSPYFLSADGKALLMRVEGEMSVHDMAGTKATVHVLEQTINRLLGQVEFHALTVHMTGGYVFAAESERVVRHDIMFSVQLSLLSICLLITWSLRRWGVLFYGPLPTLLGLFFALGMFAVLRPTLNALTLGCVASLLGLGVDYTLHILLHAFALQGAGTPKVAALRLAVRDTGSGLILAAVTTIAAFASFLLARQHFLRDMGLLTALGIAWCCLLSITLLPALLALFATPARLLPPRPLGIPGLIRVVLRWPRLVLSVSAVLSLASGGALLYWPPAFETDLRNIHAANSTALKTQETMAALFGGSQEPLTVIVEGATETQVLQDLQRLQPHLTALVDSGALAAVTSPALFYPPLQAQTAVIERLRALAVPQVMQTLETLLAEAGFDVAALQGYLQHVQRALQTRDPVDLAAFRALGFDTLLQPFLAHDAQGAMGIAVLFPARDLWTQEERDTLTRRLDRLLAATDIRATLSGLYTVSSASAALIGADFEHITLLAAGIIVVLVGLQFRRKLLLVLLPVGCGSLWAAGFFALYGFKLNFMNIAILPMLLGVGIDYGIYLVHQFSLQEQPDVRQATAKTGAAIELSALTTMLAFGTLALSTNQGIASVGVLSLVGIICCFLAALCTLPATLQQWSSRT